MRNWVSAVSLPGQPPSPRAPDSRLYPVSFPPPPPQFHNLTLNGVRGAGAGAAEGNFRAPSAVEKPPRLSVLKASGALPAPAPPPRPRVRWLQVRRTPRAAARGSRGRRVTRALAGGPRRPPGPPLLHRRAADPGWGEGAAAKEVPSGLLFQTGRAKCGDRREGRHVKKQYGKEDGTENKSLIAGSAHAPRTKLQL